MDTTKNSKARTSTFMHMDDNPIDCMRSLVIDMSCVRHWSDDDMKDASQAIDDAIDDATSSAGTACTSDETGTPFGVVSAVARKSVIPLRINVVPPVRVPISADTPVDVASQMLEDYKTAYAMYSEFRDADMTSSRKIFDALLSQAVSQAVPSMSDDAIASLKRYVSSLNASDVLVVENARSICDIIAQVIGTKPAGRRRQRRTAQSQKPKHEAAGVSEPNSEDFEMPAADDDTASDSDFDAIDDASTKPGEDNCHA